MIDYINKLFNKDNLELLKELPDKCIDLIYCDILYNTGKKFRDFNDNLGTPAQAINWYKPRLFEMFRVLKETGSIYLQCDFRIVHYLKIEMDNIFGINNFRNDICWTYDRWTNVSNCYQRMHDNILFYAKSKNNVYQEIRVPLYKTRKRNLVQCNNGSKISKKDENGNVIYKIQTDKPINDVWTDIPRVPNTGKTRVGYNTQKPVELLERIIKVSSKENDLVADFFCGSGTTCVVAKQLGRKYLGCDLNKKAIDITNKRLIEIE